MFIGLWHLSTCALINRANCEELIINFATKPVLSFAHCTMLFSSSLFSPLNCAYFMSALQVKCVLVRLRYESKSYFKNWGACKHSINKSLNGWVQGCQQKKISQLHLNKSIFHLKIVCFAVYSTWARKRKFLYSEVVIFQLKFVERFRQTMNIFKTEWNAVAQSMFQMARFHCNGTFSGQKSIILIKLRDSCGFTVNVTFLQKTNEQMYLARQTQLYEHWTFNIWFSFSSYKWWETSVVKQTLNFSLFLWPQSNTKSIANSNSSSFCTSQF